MFARWRGRVGSPGSFLSPTPLPRASRHRHGRTTPAAHRGCDPALVWARWPGAPAGLRSCLLGPCPSVQRGGKARFHIMRPSTRRTRHTWHPTLPWRPPSPGSPGACVWRRPSGNQNRVLGVPMLVPLSGAPAWGGPDGPGTARVLPAPLATPTGDRRRPDSHRLH